MQKVILIVEDDIHLIKVLNKKLSSEGFIVIDASNGQEGLQKAETEHPDLILLDIVMPVMDGLTMLKKLREKEWGKQIKVILLTNLSDEEKVIEEEGLGHSDYLIKADWSLEDIVKKIKEKLNIK
ncbi:MAG: response regulator [Candidatus Staskawiczbacteria bacterium]